MFDNLRDDAKSSPFYEDDQAQFQPAAGTVQPAIKPKSARFLGMTAQQRFVIAVMLMLMVCMLGLMLMMVTGTFGLY
jgi:hypothetical protein